MADDDPLHPLIAQELRRRLLGIANPEAMTNPLGQQPVQSAVTDVAAGMVDPVLQAGNYVGGIMQGSQQFNWPQTVQAAAGLGSMFVPGPAAEEAALARGAAGAAERAAGRLPLELTTPEGLAIRGKGYGRAAKNVMREIEGMPIGAGPLDLTSPTKLPQIMQQALERYEPVRGTSPRMRDALKNPDVINGVSDSIKAGVEMGAHEWYGTDAIRKAFIDELGNNYGPIAFEHYMNMVGGTSPRAPVPTNIRNASYYYMMQQRGLPLPEELPYPYGSIAQRLHRQNFATLSAGGIDTPGSFDIFQNPKPASFVQNLLGNLIPVTVDTHAFRNIGIRTRDPRFLENSISVPLKGNESELSQVRQLGEISDDGKNAIFRPKELYNSGRLTMDELVDMPAFWASKPNENEYAAVEKFYQELAKAHRLPPGKAQAAAWAGAGKLTGLASSPTHTFQQLMNQRLLYTAMMRGEDPKQTLRSFIRAEKPLLGVAAAGPAAGLLLGPPQQEER